jgi:hypothetical protein
VLGALAIISAILIVMADRERRSTPPADQTVTDTVAPDAPAPPAAPSGWTDQIPAPDAPPAALPAMLPAMLFLTDPTAHTAAHHNGTAL